MGHAIERRTAPLFRVRRAALETVALQCYFGWGAIDTALHYVHVSGRHALDAARQARPPLPTGHVEDRV